MKRPDSLNAPKVGEDAADFGKWVARRGKGRPRTRQYVDEIPRLDLRRWRLTDWLRPGESVPIYEPELRFTPVIASFNRDGRTLTLRCDTLEQPSVTTAVRYSGRHFGGQRVFLACPRCGRGAEVLYFPQTGPSCRICLGLRYQCQSESALDRHARALKKIQRRFDPEGPKPWKQRWWTYFRDYQRFSELRGRFFRTVEKTMQKQYPGLAEPLERDGSKPSTDSSSSPHRRSV